MEPAETPEAEESPKEKPTGRRTGIPLLGGGFRSPPPISRANNGYCLTHIYVARNMASEHIRMYACVHACICGSCRTSETP